jgi:hypothetical protein
MFRRELLYFQSDDLGKASRESLRYNALLRRKFKPDKGDLQRPVDSFGPGSEDHPPKREEQQSHGKK